MMPSRELPLPGSTEARNLGCTCPAPDRSRAEARRPVPIDEACPVHGAAANARDRAAETGPIDTEGDIVDAASEPELRRD